MCFEGVSVGKGGETSFFHVLDQILIGEVLQRVKNILDVVPMDEACIRALQYEAFTYLFEEGWQIVSRHH